MRTFYFKGVKILLYTSYKEFARKEILEGNEEFKDVDINYIKIELPKEITSAGFACPEKNRISIYASKKVKYLDLYETVSHELGHLIEGGFKKNPPHKPKYFNKHEEKANHYEKFAVNCLLLTNKIRKKIKEKNLL